MYLTAAALPLLACISYVSADALTDFALLRTLVATVASNVARSLTIPPIDPNANSTNPAFTRPVGLPYNTSEAVQNVTFALKISTVNYNLNQTAFVNGSDVTTMDNAYFDYINLIPTLAQALVARGRAWHSELNGPVYDSMQNLSQAIYVHSQGLTARDLVQTRSTIRAITASSAIIDGQDAWDAPGWLPGS